MIFTAILITCLIIGYVKAATVKIDEPAINYKELFPSSDVTDLSSSDTVDLLGQTVLASEKHHYFWLLSHFPLLSYATVKVLSVHESEGKTFDNQLMALLLAPDDRNLVMRFKERRLDLEDIRKSDYSLLFREVFMKVYKYLLQ